MRDPAGKSAGVARIKYEARQPALAAIAKYNGQIADGGWFDSSAVTCLKPRSHLYPI